MKKFVTSILVAALLLSLFAVQVFAAEDSAAVSIKGAKGKPGDIVEVQLYMDENQAYGLVDLMLSIILPIFSLEMWKMEKYSVMENL